MAANSGISIDWQPDIAESAAAVAAGMAVAYTAVAGYQQASHDFIVASGSEVVSGHSPVGNPGAMGDPDSSGPDASDA